MYIITRLRRIKTRQKDALFLSFFFPSAVPEPLFIACIYIYIRVIYIESFEEIERKKNYEEETRRDVARLWERKGGKTKERVENRY